MPNVNVALEPEEYSFLLRAKNSMENRAGTTVTWAEFFLGIVQESKWAVKK